MSKDRIDTLLVEKGHFPTREKAKRSVMAGLVYIGEVRIDKPGTMVPNDSVITVREGGNPYVGKGGLKLEKGLNEFNIDVKGKVCIDIGASTGGFTDCLLKQGASKVYAVDVGYGQLDYSLRDDERVINMERTNVRNLTGDDFSLKPEFIVIDVSFIGLSMVLPVACNFIEEGQILCLVKPQFEAGKEKVGKGGIVKDKEVHKEVISSLVKKGSELKLSSLGLTWSPVKGAKGNIEYLLLFQKGKGGREVISIGDEITRTVEEAHSKMG